MKLKIYNSGETQTFNLRNPAKVYIETESGRTVELTADAEGRLDVRMDTLTDEQLDLEGLIR